MLDFREYTARETDLSKPWKIYLLRSGHVAFGLKAAEGTLPITSCHTDVEALELLSLACPLSVENSDQYIAEELFGYQGEYAASRVRLFTKRLDRCRQKIESTL